MTQQVVNALVMAVAVVAARQWHRRHDAPSRWVAAAFGTLAVAVSPSLLPLEHGTVAAIVAGKISLTALLVFPFLLLCFASSLHVERRSLRPAGVVTGVLALACVATPSRPGERPSVWVLVLLAAIAVQWTSLCVWTGVSLWRTGAGQPTVARRRMRLLAVSCALIDVALIAMLAGASSQSARTSSTLREIVASASLVLFAVAFVPPAALRRLWRRPEEDTVRAAERELMTVTTADEVLTSLLHVASVIVAGRAVRLTDHHGDVVASAGPACGLPTIRMPAPSGTLELWTDDSLVFFGSEELALLGSFLVSVELALDRCAAVAALNDVATTLAETNRDLERSQSVLADAQTQAQLGSFAWDLSTGEISWSDELARILGYERQAVEDHKSAFLSVVHPDDLDRIVGEVALAECGRPPRTSTYRVVHPDGTVRTVEGRVRVVEDATGHRLIGTVQDVTERKALDDVLQYAALHDALTGLANRPLLVDRLRHAIARTQRTADVGPAVLFLDLDRFKSVNDSLGHAAGDVLLRVMADRLTDHLRPGDTVARFGGDEFVLLIEDVTDLESVQRRGEELMHSLRSPVDLGGTAFVPTFSLGIAIGTPGASAESLLRDADTAMYKAKERGRNRYEVFDDDLRVEVTHWFETEAALRHALDADELEVWYQPEIDLATGQVAACEALVRWPRPGMGVLAAGAFVPLAEETSLILQLGQIVLEKACRDIASLNRRLGARLTVAVNVSARQLTSGLMPDVVANALGRSGLDPKLLCLELTETALLSDADTVLTTLRDLKALGLSLAVDDFGTGYSSLTNLRRFPLDVLKIDRAFVSGIDEHAEDELIVSTLIGLAHSFGLTTVAEGAERTSQADRLRALGADAAQGYLWAEALPIDRFAARIAQLGLAPSAAPGAPGAPAGAAAPERRAHARSVAPAS